MSLDKTLHEHLDEMESIEEIIRADIDEIIANIDTDLLLQDPQKALGEVVELVRELMINEYIPMASEQGFNLHDSIKSMPLKVDPSKDGEKNKELVNDNGND